MIHEGRERERGCAQHFPESEPYEVEEKSSHRFRIFREPLTLEHDCRSKVQEFRGEVGIDPVQLVG